MQFKILTHNNGVGIVTDAILLKELIYKNISENVEIKFLGEHNIESGDVGIWIQNYDINLLNLYKKNIFFINEEWAGMNELLNLHLFDYVVCKSSYAKKLLNQYCDVVHLPFISKNYYDNNIKKQNKILHFAGKSIQKNTELVLKQNLPITLLDSSNKHVPNINFNHINYYQSDENIIHILNSHNIHICCSLYESWGHYLFEGLSTGSEIICSRIPVFEENLDANLVHFLPTIEQSNNLYYYCSDNQTNKFPLRKSFFVNEIYFENFIENFKPINKSNERIKLFNDITKKNSEKIINFFKQI